CRSGFSDFLKFSRTFRPPRGSPAPNGPARCLMRCYLRRKVQSAPNSNTPKSSRQSAPGSGADTGGGGFSEPGGVTPGGKSGGKPTGGTPTGRTPTGGTPDATEPPGGMGPNPGILAMSGSTVKPSRGERSASKGGTKAGVSSFSAEGSESETGRV